MGNSKIINRTKDTDAEWIAENPILSDGEFGYAKDTHIVKVGDGVTVWSALEGVRMANNEAKLGVIVALPKSICYPESLDFVADYNVTDVFDATWARGDRTGTPHEGAMVIYGFLSLETGAPPGSLGKYVDYSGVLSANAAVQQGCIRFQFTPIVAAGSVYFDSKVFTLMNSEVSMANCIEIMLSNESNDYGVYINMTDKNGDQICSQYLGNWTDYTVNIPYEFELNWDLDLGETRLFIGGIQFGSTIVSTGLRDENINIIRVGNGHSPENYSSYQIMDSVRVYHSVIHTEDYTPGVDDEALFKLPENLSAEYGGDYVACVGGVVDHVSSPYHGMQIPDMVNVDSNVMWAWKIFD